MTCSEWRFSPYLCIVSNCLHLFREKKNAMSLWPGRFIRQGCLINYTSKVRLDIWRKQTENELTTINPFLERMNDKLFWCGTKIARGSWREPYHLVALWWVQENIWRKVNFNNLNNVSSNPDFLPFSARSLFTLCPLYYWKKHWLRYFRWS
jgi:hypothetical protein